jgi:hypothetical protein
VLLAAARANPAERRDAVVFGATNAGSGGQALAAAGDATLTRTTRTIDANAADALETADAAIEAIAAGIDALVGAAGRP